MIKHLIKINHLIRKKFGFGISICPYRASVNFIKNKFQNKEMVCAEIGTFEGENAEYILKNLNIKKIYLIDPWSEYGDYKEKSKTQKNLNKAYTKTLKRLRKYKDKIVIIKKFSSPAVKDIPNNLDFVYIDGNHDYKFVKEDLENYYKKLKIGGILAGHDIYMPGVSKAFCEFVTKKKLQPYIWPMDFGVIKK